MITLQRSTRRNKKLMVTIDNKKIHFGQFLAKDYTMHNNLKLKKAYLARHRKREDWNRTGIKTAGFWSRWILWNRKTIEGSIKDIERMFNVDINNLI